MCDCDELEYEDFEVMLAAISKTSRPQMEEVHLEAPIPLLVAARRGK